MVTITMPSDSDEFSESCFGSVQFEVVFIPVVLIPMVPFRYTLVGN
jgi:hypothetical protein